MPRKPTLTGYSNADSHATFKDALTTLGQRVDPRTDRCHAILIDGVPLGDRLGELRKPGTSFYEKTFAEANAVAHLAVNLDLDCKGAVDVIRLPEGQPDTRLTLDGNTVAFVEQTMVMDQAAHRLSLDIEAINAAVLQSDDPRIASAFERGTLAIRFNEVPERYYETGLPINKVIQQILTLVRSLGDGDLNLKADAVRMPLLAEMRTLAAYRIGGRTGSPVTLVDHGRPGLVESRLLEQLRKKRQKAASYPQGCRPLWLLLNIDHHFGYHDFTPIATAIIQTEKPTEYDRIIVEQVYAKPLVVDLSHGS